MKIDKLVEPQFDPNDRSPQAANAAFLESLFGQDQRDYLKGIPELGDFYLKALETIRQAPEVESLFPEGLGINQNRQGALEALRAKRAIRITKPNPDPISDPAREILFTSNVLLTLPASIRSLQASHLSSELKARIAAIMDEEQLYWYDHPIQIGVKPEGNEILYGLKKLDEAIADEHPSQKVICVLSVSVTHAGLQQVAGEYIRQEIKLAGGLDNLDVFVFTEADTSSLIEQVLRPAACLPGLDVFGVDGEYGRHYSFLKAVLPLWHQLMDQDKRATFKIDLDQVFPQKELKEQTGMSAFEHFMTPNWGAEALDSSGNPIELGMLAGALVNERDFHRGLFTPDVPFPERELSPDEKIFFSTLPQALSTEAEMMTRDESIERIHVTGGTNGILLDHLKRHRPFTPSFIARAEDQGYILSVLGNSPRLAYLHAAGLIMRHDKEAFAQEAIQAAFIGKLLGDYIRTLVFSAYAEELGDKAKIKKLIDPFTGCFVSDYPEIVVYLRFALRAHSFFEQGQTEQGNQFIKEGVRRITACLNFIADGSLASTYAEERRGWDNYYASLDQLNDELIAKGRKLIAALQV